MTRPIATSILVIMQAENKPAALLFQNMVYDLVMKRKNTKPKPKQGAYLAELRKAAGLSQTELGRLIGETQQNIAFWEQCTYPPRSDVLIKLSKVLGVSVEDLLTGQPTKKRKGGPTGKVQKIFEAVSRLPKKQQEKIVEFVSAFVNQYQNQHA